MYKFHFQKWNLRKNLGKGEVSEIYRRVATGANIVAIPSDLLARQRVNEQRLRRYLQQLPRSRYQEVTAGTGSSATEDAESTAQHPVQRTSCRAPTPEAESSRLFSLSSPEDWRIVEQSKLAMRHYIMGGYESKLWVRDPKVILGKDDLDNLLWEQGYFPYLLLKEGKTAQAFHALQSYFNKCRSTLRTQSPYVFLYTYFVAFTYAERFPDVSRVFISYVRNLVAILYPGRHPLRTLMDNLWYIGPSRIKDSSRPMVEGLLEAFHHEFCAGSVVTGSMVPFMYPVLVYEKQVESSVAEEKIRNSVTLMEETQEAPFMDEMLSGKISLAFLLRIQGKFVETRQVFNEMLAYPADLMSALTQAFILESMVHLVLELDEHDEIILVLNNLVRCNHREFGPDDNRTGQALSNLETYLRKTGDVETAEQVRHDFDAVMDQICGDVGELTL